MDYGHIISRSWHITWRYRALWVLGIFAGVSGCAGGSSGGSSGGGSGETGGMRGGAPQFQRLWDQVDSFIPLLVGIAVLLVFVGLIWWIFAVAARGGLVSGVNAIEEGHPEPLARLWHVGFQRFWSLLGVDVMLALPMVVIGLFMLAAIGVPVMSALMAGREPGRGMIAPLCGSLAIGLPLSLVASFVLGIMRLVAQRYVMLGDRGAVQAVKDSWGFLRVRLKDSAIIWLINAALNMAASLVLAIPAFMLGVAVAVPMVAAIASEEWGALAAGIPIAVILFTLLFVVYNAIWGTYTSSLWTLFFRQAAGMTPAFTAMPHTGPAAGRYGGYAAAPPSQSGYVPTTPGPATGWAPPIEGMRQPATPAEQPAAPPAPPAPPAEPPVAPPTEPPVAPPTEPPTEPPVAPPSDTNG